MLPRLWQGPIGRLSLVVILAFILFFASWTLAASLVEGGLVLEPKESFQAAATEQEVRVNPQDTPETGSTALLEPVPQQPAPEKTQQPEPVDWPTATPEVPADHVPEISELTAAELRELAFPAVQYTADLLGRNPKAEKRIALTFDDGPVPGWTEKYLEVLSEHQVPATFFLIGTYATKAPDLVQKVALAGHDIGAHSNSHKKLTQLKQEQVTAELWAAATGIFKITSQPVAYFRPPYGATDRKVIEAARELGQTVILWNVDPRDWETADAKKIANHVLNRAGPGSIILLHEGKAQTLQALPLIIEGLKAQGYELVTVSELFNYHNGSEEPREEQLVVSAPTSRGMIAR